MPSEPRAVIAHSPFDEDTREMLLDVYENIHRKYRLDDAIASAVVARILALAEAGERSPEAKNEFDCPKTLILGCR